MAGGLPPFCLHFSLKKYFHMKKLHLLLLVLCTAAASFAGLNRAEGQGLIISEVFANPAGTDGAQEFVELVATEYINFAATPYCVAFANNGTATINGWVAGGSLTYGYNITSGTVNAGDIVYVGGTDMAPVGPRLRQINNNTTSGDRFGNPSTSGVLGNGGANSDAVVVFAQDIFAITDASVPVDVIFFGTGHGTAVVSGGSDGYVLPTNDNYSGGFLQTTSFIAPDAVSGNYLVATGTYDTLLNTFTAARTWANAGAYTTGSSISLSSVPPPASISIVGTHQTISETQDSAFFNVTVANANSMASSFDVQLVAGTAADSTDYIFANYTVTIPAGGNGAYAIGIELVDDTLAEQSEYVFFKLANLVNATQNGTNQYTLYLADDDFAAPTATNSLSLQLLGSYSNGAAGTNAAEVVAYDPSTKRLYIANSIGKKLDIFDMSNPAALALLNSVSITPYGNINSVAAHNGLVAAAIENTSPQLDGSVVLFDSAGNWLNTLPAGAMPDMIMFNHAGTKIYTANEGEPNAAYTSDPVGSVTVVDVTGGAGAATAHNISFAQFNGQEVALRASGVRIYGANNASAEQDFEPESVIVSDDDATAWVSLQENNALLKIDLVLDSVVAIFPLGTKNNALAGNGFDVSDVTSAVNIANWPIKSFYEPDEIGFFQVGGTQYIVTANEGDTREYTGLNEVSSLSAMNLDAAAFPNSSFYKSNFAAGKLKVTNKNGDTDGDGDFDEIYAFGGRSFSVFNAQTGALVWDSGDDFEQITNADTTFSLMFNASNGTSIVKKNRSDDKGPEPEGIAIGTVGGTQYAFIGLERIGGVMAYELTDPTNPVFAAYANNRSLASNGPDRGPEDVLFIPAEDAPLGQPILILGNEVSSTITVYSLCAGGGALQTFYADADGDGFGTAAETTLACELPASGYSADTTDCDDTNASIHPGATEICSNGVDEDCDGADASLAFDATLLPSCTSATKNKVTIENAAGTPPYQYSKDGGQTFGTNPVFQNLAAGTYIFVAVDATGCSASQLVDIMPLMALTTSGNGISCFGSNDGTASVAVAGGYAPQTYAWALGTTPVGTTQTITNLLPGSYKVTVSDAYGCTKTATRVVAQPALLKTTLVRANVTCNGAANGTIATTTTGGTAPYGYNWSDGSTDEDRAGLAPGIYTVTVTDAHGCTATGSTAIIEPLALVLTITKKDVLCNGGSTGSASAKVTGGTGSKTYSWSNGGSTATLASLAAGTYTVTVTDALGCTISGSATIVEPAVLAILSIASAPAGANYTVTVTASGGVLPHKFRRSTSATTWTGYNGTGVFTNVPAGTYTFEVLDKNKCVASLSQAIPATTLRPANARSEQAQTLENLSFVLAPNPANSVVNLRFEGIAPTSASLEMRDAAGRLLRQTAVAAGPISLDGLPSGVLFVTLKAEGFAPATKRLVVSK